MTNDLTYAELFAGAGGLSLGLETAGWRAVAHAEIESHARAILRRHWPDCRLDGDVSVVNGADYAGVTLLSGGSPCQDLSVAGKRAGMVEGSGTRSSLFFEQVRIWQESQAPYFLWENVLGAFSSNAGRDFAAVLSALVGALIAVPANGWESAGVAAGPTGVAAWRVLDCQFFGPPQRRRRVFVLGARAGGVDPAEVLALSEGLRGDSPPRREAGQDASADARGGAHLAVNVSDGAGSLDRVMGTLGARSGGQEVGAHTRGVVMAFHHRQDPISGAESPALGTSTDGMGVLAFEWHGADTRFKHTTQAPTLNTRQDNGQGQVLVLCNREPDVSATLTASDGEKWGANQWVDEGKAHIGACGIPRRLMPVECERLQGWPDHWTAEGIAEDGTRYALSDTARYRAIGNGVASPVAAWIGWRLREALEAQ